VTPPDTGPVLDVDDVTVDLGGRRVLESVTFAIGPGEFTALIGPNGSGKTTLLRVILGLQRAAGRVRVAGGRRGGRRSVGYVPQKVMLDPDLPMRGRDLISLGLDGNRPGLPLPSAARRQRVEEMVAAVGAQTFADARVGRLSGGEQQRILIAHALISRPRLLLLDEPLANLDLRSGGEVVDLLSRLAADQGTGVLLSAHDVNPLVRAMDRVVYLAGGRAATGTTGEVIRTDVLSGLYGHHVDVLRVHDRIVIVAGHEGGHDACAPEPDRRTMA
jgi:zinc/manganese transport system ATP-binding protein